MCVNLFGQTLYDVDTLIYKCTPFIIFNRVGLFICWTITCKKKNILWLHLSLLQGQTILEGYSVFAKSAFLHPSQREAVGG